MLLKKILRLSKEIKEIHATLKEVKKTIEKVKCLEENLGKITEENQIIKRDFYIIASYINSIHHFIEENMEYEAFEYDMLKKKKKEEYH